MLKLLWIAIFVAYLGITSGQVFSQQLTDENSDHKSAVAAYEAGVDAVGKEHYEQALKSFKDALALEPGYANAWHGLGVAHAFLGQNEASVMDFKEAIKHDPESKRHWYSLGLAYSELHENEEALQAFQEVVGIDATDAKGWFYLGKTYESLRNTEQAARSYRQATANDPHSADAWYSLGGLFVYKDDDEAIADYSKAVELKPDYTEAWERMGDAYNDSKRFQMAIGPWKKSLNVEGANGGQAQSYLWSKIGAAYYELKDYKNAEQATQKAFDLEAGLPTHTVLDDERIRNILLQLEQIYDKMGNHRRAEYYRKAFLYSVNHN